MILDHVLKILIAEDDRGVQTLLRTILSREGYAVECASDGIAALECCTSISYDAILLDLTMPKASGTDVLRQIQERGRADVLSRIIVVTAASAKDVAGVHGVPVIRKPFDLNDLLAAIRRIAGASAGPIELDAKLLRTPSDVEVRTPSTVHRRERHGHRA